MTGRAVRALAVVLMGLLLAACGAQPDATDSDEASVGPPRTVAFLRAVQSSQPENQAAFLDELASNGYSTQEGNLRLIAAASSA